MPIKWYSERQSMVETSTYGTDMVAARIATELINVDAVQVMHAKCGKFW